MNFFVLNFLVVAFGAVRASHLCHLPIFSEAKQAATASNNFAFQLYKKIAEENPSKNIIFSPASISLGLALLGSGANGTTLTELQNALRPPNSNDLDSSNKYQTLQSQLQGGGTDDTDYKFNVANGLFYNKNVLFKSPYVSNMRVCFHAEVMPVPFEEDAEGARKQINSWVSNQTNGKIPELFKPGGITSGDAAVIANAIYFKAMWHNKFVNTENRNFYKFGKLRDNQNVQFLARTNDYDYAGMANADVVKIPYQLFFYTMYIILPKQLDGIQQVEQSVTGNILSSLQFQTRQVDLKIPKFTTRLSFDLKKILQQAGQNVMFTEKADFNRMSDTFLKVSSAVHEAFIKVNENGTEAAAASAFRMPLGASPGGEPEVPISFIADHPFMFAVVHERTDAIIFTGRINYVEKDD